MMICRPPPSACFDVRGVTKLQNNSYVLTVRPNRILKYDDDDQNNSFQLKEELKIDQIRCPQEMVGSNASDCLYISDSGSRCVWKITPRDQKIALWLSDYSWALSVLNDGKVIMPRWGQLFSLEIYGEDGILVGRVRLPVDIELPKHTVETSEGNLVLSHWCQSRKAWTVSELSRDGQVIRSYNPLNQSQTLDDPCCLSIDSENRVYVADCFNRNRVIVLDSKLKWEGALLTYDRNAILFPKVLYYDRLKMQLLVVHGYNRKVVDIYSICNRDQIQ